MSQSWQTVKCLPKNYTVVRADCGNFLNANLKKWEIPESIRITEQQTTLPKTTLQQLGPSKLQSRMRSQSPKHNFRNRSMESENQTTKSQATPQVTNQPNGDPRGLPKLKLTEFSEDPLEWPEWAEIFNFIVNQNRLSDSEKMQYLKISLTGQSNAAISGLGFSSQAYYQAWDILCKNLADRESLLNLNSRRYTHTRQLDTMIPVALFDFQMWSQTQLTFRLDSEFHLTWNRREFEFRTQKIFRWA